MCLDLSITVKTDVCLVLGIVIPCVVTWWRETQLKCIIHALNINVLFFLSK